MGVRGVSRGFLGVVERGQGVGQECVKGGKEASRKRQGWDKGDPPKSWHLIALNEFCIWI